MRTRSVTVKPLLQHFFSGPEGQDWLDTWARKCGLEPATVDDPHAWLPSEYYYGLFDRISQTSDNPHEEVRLAARRGLSRENLGSLHVLARAFGRPRSAYARYAVYLNSLQNFGKYELHVLQPGAATISFTPQADLPSQELDCIYRRGALEALPTLWRLPTARIGHECCLARGAPNCIYEIKWVPLRQRRISWAASAAGLGVGGLVWGGLAASGLLPAGAMLAAATVAPWPVLGFLAGKGWLLGRQLRDTSQLMSEQMRALEREIRNIWSKCEESEKRAEAESKIRRIFQKYVPSQVVDRVLEEEERAAGSAGGERAEVTVLFADLVGFTSYAEDNSADEVMATVNRYLGRFSEVIGTYGGVVDKYIGDNVMAVFGAPVLDPFGPSKAVNCAQHLLKTVRETNAQTGLNFDLRVGVHHGNAVAGHVGSDERVNYTVIGDTVNLAQRLQTEASPGTALVSEAVRKRCDNAKDFVARGEVTVRGRSRGVPVYELS